MFVELKTRWSDKAKANQFFEFRIGDLARLAEQGEQHRPFPDRKIITRHDQTALFVVTEYLGILWPGASRPPGIVKHRKSGSRALHGASGARARRR